MQPIVVEYLLPGSLLGIIAALSPGPLMALIVSESIRGGLRSGARVAMAPLVTDIPFIIVAIVIARGIESSPTLLGITSLIGAAFLTYLAFQNMKIRKSDFELSEGEGRSLTKGIVVNLCNPHMYLYWFSVATPVFARGNTYGSTLFAAGLLGCSVLMMLLIAGGVARVRMKVFRYAHLVLRILGASLLYFAFVLLRDGVTFIL